MGILVAVGVVATGSLGVAGGMVWFRLGARVNHGAAEKGWRIGGMDFGG